MATALLTITAIASIGSIIQNRRASQEQRRQNRIQNRIARITRSRNIRRAIAERRIRTADIQSLGFQLGVAGGTAEQGAAAGITSDVAGAIGQSNIQLVGQESAVASANRVSRLQTSAGTLGTVSSILVPFTGSQGAQNRAAIADLV